MTRFFVFVVVLFAAIAAAAYSTLQSFNHFGAVERSFAGRCAPVAGLFGPEDIQIDHANGRAFISSLDRRDKDARGAIHLFDLGDPLGDAGWRDRTGGVPEVFKPLGLYYYADDEVSRLFVVNDANKGVELFDVLENGDLEHLSTFKERRLTSPNDVVAIGPQSFYVTNDVKSGRDGPVAAFLFLVRAKAGEVLFTDGTVWRVAAEDLRFANGINMSPDASRLYVSETAGGVVRVFNRDVRTGRLTDAASIVVDGAPDNINVDETGALWVSALPKPLSIARLSKDPSMRAPSQIVRIGAGADGATLVYRDDGEEISAATVAARSGSQLIIGALFDKKFLICELPES